MLPKTRCSKGDLAWVIKSLVSTNLRKIVTIGEYIGYMQANDGIELNGIYCKVPITDHYWWIHCPSGLDTFMGPTSKAMGPDTWLEPIKPTLLDDDEDIGQDIYKTIPVEPICS